MDNKAIDLKNDIKSLTEKTCFSTIPLNLTIVNKKDIKKNEGKVDIEVDILKENSMPLTDENAHILYTIGGIHLVVERPSKTFGLNFSILELNKRTKKIKKI